LVLNADHDSDARFFPTETNAPLQSHGLSIPSSCSVVQVSIQAQSQERAFTGLFLYSDYCPDDVGEFADDSGCFWGYRAIDGSCIRSNGRTQITVQYKDYSFGTNYAVERIRYDFVGWPAGKGGIVRGRVGMIDAEGRIQDPGPR
jgi:hypothetical protein